MPDWSNPCGVAYKWYDDGRFEVEGLGFPDYPQGRSEEARLTKIWQKWGWYISEASRASQIPASWIISVLYSESGGKTNSRSACTAKLCPALWKQGQCADQGGPNQFCAGGLMGFTQMAAKMYGHTVDWYFTDDETEGQQILDGADLLVRKILHYNGEVLSGIKNYNGGKPCSDTGLATGPGILNMYGQGDYVEKIVRLSNTFSRLPLSEPVKPPPGPKPVKPDQPFPPVVKPGASVATGASILLGVGATFAVVAYWGDITDWYRRHGSIRTRKERLA